MKLKHYIKESRNQKVISVDIQPEYNKHISFNLSKYFDWLSQQSSILYFYNGADTVGRDTESDVISFMVDNGFPEEDIHNVEFVDKGYAFFRAWMDYGVDEDDIIKVVKHMISRREYDSRDIKDFHKLVDLDDLPEDEPIAIPDISFSLLNRYNSSILVGGGSNECLLEIELLLRSLNISYRKNNQFIY
jgi:hypothetical protein